MSNIAIIGDLHIGVGCDNQHRLKFQLDYLETDFFNYLKENNIKTILQLGDVFHSRKSININTFHWTKKRFFDPLQKMGIQMYVLMGNHDSYYTQFNDITGLSILKEYSNITIIEKPKLLEIDGFKFSMIPWIANKNDEKHLTKFIKDNPHSITFGHLELKNFEVIPGYKMESGMSEKIFKDFDVVYSGHYHNKQSRGNIFYLGTPYELTWHDFNSEKGFYVLNTETKKIEFILNKKNLYEKIYYDEDFVHSNIIELQRVKGKIVKIYIVKKTKDPVFSNFLYELEQAKPESFSIIENDDGNEELSVDDTNKSLISIIDDYVTDLKREDHNKLMNILKYLYNRALEE